MFETQKDGGANIDNGCSHYTTTPAIQYLLDHGIASGYPDPSAGSGQVALFKPENPINRAEFTKIIVGAVGLSTEGLCKMASFSDVMGAEWYGPFAQAARCAGIIGGYPDGTFRPARNINTAEAAKIVVEAFGLEVSVQDAETWYAPYMETLEGIEALPSTATDPAHLLTRGEMAEVIYRVMVRVEEQE
ncbi:MAG: S-layer homology domain-containing protein [Candidatus Peribacteraceae bacterium]|nr:S-layer homology domain-containing protein [Candidatus Peribacteraceae bacterium]